MSSDSRRNCGRASRRVAVSAASSSVSFVVSSTTTRALFFDPTNSFEKWRVDSRDASWISGCYSQGMRGFSLLEVLVATTIVAVGVSALAQLTGIATHANRHARQSTMAAVLAQKKMEELLAEEAGTLTPSPADALGHNVD